jgi:hypothetical protein
LAVLNDIERALVGARSQQTEACPSKNAAQPPREKEEKKISFVWATTKEEEDQ